MDNFNIWRLMPFFLVTFIDSIGWGIVYPAFELLLIENKLGMLPSDISISWRNMYFVTAISIYCLCEFVAAPILGYFSDRHGRKPIIMLSLLGTCLGFLFCSLAVSVSSFSLLLISRIVCGLTSGNLSVVQAAVADHSPGEKLSENLNYVILCNGLGFIIGPFLGGILMQPQIFGSLAYQLPFLLIGLLALIAMCILGFTYVENWTKSAIKGKLLFNFIKQTSEIFNRDSQVALYLIILTIFILARIMFFTQLPIIFQHRFDTHGASIGWLMGYFAILLTLGTFGVFPWISKRYDSTQVIWLSLSIQLISYALFVLIPLEIVSWILIAPIALTVPFIYVSLVTLISNKLPKEVQGQAMGVIGSLAALSWWLGPLMSGGLMFMGEYCLYIAIVLLIMICLTLIKKTKKLLSVEIS